MEVNNYHIEQGNTFEGPAMNSHFGLKLKNQDNSNESQETKYQCPMSCEGNITYNKSGACPVCNMQLIIVGIDRLRLRSD